MAFVFGFLAGGDAWPYSVTDPGSLFVFGFRVLPVILVDLRTLSAVLWHWRILKWITQGFASALCFQKTFMGLRGPPAFAVAATIFMGQIEGPIFIRTYLKSLTRSELFMLIVVGMSCVSGSTMVAYATILKAVLPNAAAHVLTASIISAPAGVLLARIMVPGPKVVEKLEDLHPEADKVYDSTIDALVKGTNDGLQIVLNVGAALIVFVALAAMVDGLLGLAPPVNGGPLSIERIAGAVFAPLTWCMGVPWKEGADRRRLAGRQAGADRVHRLHKPVEDGPGADFRPHPDDHDLRPVRFRQHRLGRHQCRRIHGAGARAASGGDGPGLEGDAGGFPGDLHDRFGHRRHAGGVVRPLGGRSPINRRQGLAAAGGVVIVGAPWPRAIRHISLWHGAGCERYVRLYRVRYRNGRGALQAAGSRTGAPILQTALAGSQGRLLGLFTPQLGWRGTQAAVLLGWPAGDSGRTATLKTLTTIPGVSVLSRDKLAATARPAPDATPHPGGIYVHRWFVIDAAGQDEFVALSVQGVGPISRRGSRPTSFRPDGRRSAPRPTSATAQPACCW